ncbi:MAG: hypothetical protein V2J14_06360 [Erythrobacter sp.]|jgi:hypothetical protein|nr:hypothetical protein [Erythrobacter sp.]
MNRNRSATAHADKLVRTGLLAAALGVIGCFTAAASLAGNGGADRSQDGTEQTRAAALGQPG